MISFQNVTKIYSPDKAALRDISLDIKEGEFLLIAGRSGAGKTTLLKLIFGEESPAKGKILFDGEDISRIKGSKLSDIRQKIGVIFQDYKLLPQKTVYENIAYPLEVLGVEDKQIKNDMKHVLELVGLESLIDNFPNELSGGEKQRTAVARALVHQPKVVLADEPTGNLDPYHSRDIIKILSRVNELGSTVIVATHSKEIINALRKRVVTLEEGKIVKDAADGRFIL